MSSLPARLRHSGYVTLVSGLSETDPAETELAVVSAGSTALAAAVVTANLVLGLARLAHLLGSLGH